MPHEVVGEVAFPETGEVGGACEGVEGFGHACHRGEFVTGVGEISPGVFLHGVVPDLEDLAEGEEVDFGIGGWVG